MSTKKEFKVIGFKITEEDLANLAKVPACCEVCNFARNYRSGTYAMKHSFCELKLSLHEKTHVCDLFEYKDLLLNETYKEKKRRDNLEKLKAPKKLEYVQGSLF